jgi:hypothetical protein
LCDDFLEAIHQRDDPQARLSTAEVMTIPLVAASFFGGEIEKTRRFLYEYGYMKKMISKSHLNRRLHAIEPTLWRVLFELLAQAFKKRNDPEFQTYVVDSLPVAVCDNIRIRRCRIYPLEEERGEDEEAKKKKSFRGYIASDAKATLLLRLAGAFGGNRSGRTGGVFFGSGIGGRRYDLQRVGVGPARRLDHLGRQGLHRLRLRGPLRRGGPASKSPAQEELQEEADGGMGGVLGQADSPVHRNGL